MKIYRFTSWVMDKHIRRNFIVHEYANKKTAEDMRKDAIASGRCASPVERVQ